MENPSTTVATAIREFADDLAQFKASNDRRLRDLEVGVSAAKRMGLSGGTASPTASRDEREHKERFTAWLRRPHDHATRRELAEAESSISRKGVSIADAASGGYAVPAEISREIALRAAGSNPLRNWVRVEQAGSSDYAKLLDANNAASGWVAESGTRNATNTPTLIQRKPTFGTLYALASATEESMNDLFFDVGNWLVESVGRQFARAEVEAIVSGNGSARPTGFLHVAPAATADGASPARSAGSLRYFPTGASAGFPAFSNTSPRVYPADTLIDALHSLATDHLADPSCAWLMNRETMATVRKFKDADGGYLWQPGIAAGSPPTLLGYPVVVVDAMPSIGANAFPIAIGAWRNAYLLVDRASPTRVIVDEVTTPGIVRFYCTRRTGGIVLDDRAARVIKCATT